ncbi:MAG: adenylate kinase [Pseudomonadota bacterium]
MLAKLRIVAIGSSSIQKPLAQPDGASSERPTIRPDTDFATRLLIIGNSGSGKTTLAAGVAARTGQAHRDLDEIHWLADGRVRDRQEALDAVAAAAAEPRWIIEGVYGWLAAAALPRATGLLWLELPWPECRASLVGRGPKPGMGDAAHAALIDWASAYDSRPTSTSAAGHRAMFESFGGARMRLQSRHAVAALLARSPGWPLG